MQAGHGSGIGFCQSLKSHFTVSSEEMVESQELRELAQDAGGGEIPMEGEEGRIVARLEPASNVSEGEEAELWVDATRLQLFDPDDGRNLTVDASGPPAVGEGSASESSEGDVHGRDPAETQQRSAE